MGFQHRKDAFGYYSVHIRSDQTWQHRHREKIDSKWLGSVLKDSGSLSHINVSGGSTNTIKLISLGEKGWLWINDQYVAELSLEERVEGTIQMSGGFYTGDVKNGYIFEDIRIKSIGTMAVSDPSGSISIDKNSGKSKFWTQGIDSPITNMIIASEITNPLDNWTTGIGLRATEELHHFAIYGGTDTYGTKYALNFHSPDTGWNIIASDYSTTMNRQKGQINKYFIIADEGNGALFINDEFVASLDFSSHLESGAIRIYADLRGAAEESATADFENVQLWHLGE